MHARRRPRLTLVSPRFKYSHYAAQRELSRLLGKKRITPPGALPLIAALTPPHWEVKIIDDESEPLDIDPVPDLVGITTLSATSDRVKEIAEVYRSLGSKIVLGGPWATFRAEEALLHADHVVIGEAEGAWQRLLADFEQGRAAPRYQNAEPPAFRTSPLPRWDLVDMSAAMTVAVETSRGCPFGCQFCVVHKMFGRRMRFRDPEDVVREIRAAPVKRVFFVADNFAINKAYAEDLVRRLTPLDVSWVCQTSIQVADDPAFLQRMADAGCISVLIGFESLNQAALEGVHKRHNQIAEFERAIERVHATGMHVLASFIVGFDEDTVDTFGVIREFVERNALSFPMMNAMSVAPGTDIYARMETQGRIEVVEPAFRNGIFPCMHYNHLSQREMLDHFFDTLFTLFDWDAITSRALRLFGTGHFAKAGREQVRLGEKISTSAAVLRRMLLAGDARKRRLFKELFKLIGQGKLAPDKAIVFLLDMLAFEDYLEQFRTELPVIRARVDRIDKGRWSERCEGGELLLSAGSACSCSSEAIGDETDGAEKPASSSSAGADEQQPWPEAAAP